MGKRKKKSTKLKVGRKYWEASGSPRRYRLLQVTNKAGGVKHASPSMKKSEAKLWVQGYNNRVGRGKGRISPP